MYPYCYLDGKIVKSDKAFIRIDDISILRGFAAFDFFRIYNGLPFCFDLHFQRFRNTAKEMGLKIPLSKNEILEVLNKLVIKNKDKNYHVKFVLTGGKTMKGILPSRPVFFILFEKMENLPDNVYKNGAKIVTNEYLRTLPTSKTSNYLNAVLLQKYKNKHKALEILYVNNGEVLECSTSNIFILKSGIIMTPKEKVLKGITRKNVIDIAIKNKITVKETEIKPADLKIAEEVFITATNKKVVPVVTIDDFQIAGGKVGDITKFLLDEYNKLII
jgi:branched-chain amino acid aminotransferase